MARMNNKKAKVITAIIIVFALISIVLAGATPENTMIDKSPNNNGFIFNCFRHGWNAS